MRLYLYHKLFIWNNLSFVRLFLFLLCVHFYIIILEIILFIQHPFLIIKLFFSQAYHYIQSVYFCSSSISMLKYKHLCEIYHDLFTIICTYSLFIHWISFFDHQNLFVLGFWFIPWIQLFDYQYINRQSLIFSIHFYMVIQC